MLELVILDHLHSPTQTRPERKMSSSSRPPPEERAHARCTQRVKTKDCEVWLNLSDAINISLTLIKEIQWPYLATIHQCLASTPSKPDMAEDTLRVKLEENMISRLNSTKLDDKLLTDI